MGFLGGRKDACPAGLSRITRCGRVAAGLFQGCEGGAANLSDEGVKKMLGVGEILLTGWI